MRLTSSWGRAVALVSSIGITAAAAVLLVSTGASATPSSGCKYVVNADENGNLTGNGVQIIAVHAHRVQYTPAGKSADIMAIGDASKYVVTSISGTTNSGPFRVTGTSNSLEYDAAPGSATTPGDYIISATVCADDIGGSTSSPPVSSPPVTSPPVSSPPVSSPPVSSPPVTLPPVTTPPVTSPPVVKPPVVKPPVVKPPVAHKPVASRTPVSQPVNSPNLPTSGDAGNNSSGSSILTLAEILGGLGLATAVGGGIVYKRRRSGEA